MPVGLNKKDKMRNNERIIIIIVNNDTYTLSIHCFIIGVGQRKTQMLCAFKHWSEWTLQCIQNHYDHPVWDQPVKWRAEKNQSTGIVFNSFFLLDSAGRFLKVKETVPFWPTTTKLIGQNEKKTTTTTVSLFTNIWRTNEENQSQRAKHVGFTGKFRMTVRKDFYYRLTYDDLHCSSLASSFVFCCLRCKNASKGTHTQTHKRTRL